MGLYAKPVQENQRRAFLLFLTIVVVLLAGVVSAWPYNAHWGCYPSGGRGLALLVLMVMGRI
ncbi:MAG TPA: DUF3309 domain-containing protein [Rhodopila sp.]